MRTRASKIFEEADGTFRAEISPDSVHYRDSSGEWADIDNTLVPSDRPGYAFENAANDYKVYIPADIAQEPILVESLGEWISYVPVDAIGAPTVSGSTATFESTSSGMDFSYTAGNEMVEELVTLQTPGVANEASSIEFELETSSGLDTSESPSGGIDFESTAGQVQMAFDPPLVFDDSPHASPDSAHVSLEVEDDQGEVSVELKASEAWLSDENRDYPVTIDPTLDPNLRDPDKDCWIGDGSMANVSNCPFNKIRAGFADGAKRRALLHFPVRQVLPSGAFVAESQLALWTESTTTSNALPASLHGLKQSWSQQATWNSYNGSTAWTPGGNFFPGNADTNLGVGGSAAKWEYWYPNELVSAWADETAANEGFILKTAVDSGNNVVFFTASESTDSIHWPELTIWYSTQPTECQTSLTGCVHPATEGVCDYAACEPYPYDDYCLAPDGQYCDGPLDVPAESGEPVIPGEGGVPMTRFNFTPPGQVMVITANVRNATCDDGGCVKVCGSDPNCDGVKPELSLSLRQGNFAKRVRRLASKPLNGGENNDGMGGFLPDIILLQEAWEDARNNDAKQLSNRLNDRFTDPGDDSDDIFRVAYFDEKKDSARSSDRRRIFRGNNSVIFNRRTMVRPDREEIFHVTSQWDPDDQVGESSLICSLSEGEDPDADGDGIRDCNHAIQKIQTYIRFEEKADEGVVVAAATLHFLLDSSFSQAANSGGTVDELKARWSEEISTAMQRDIPDADLLVIGGDFNQSRCIKKDQSPPEQELGWAGIREKAQTCADRKPFWDTLTGGAGGLYQDTVYEVATRGRLPGDANDSITRQFRDGKEVSGSNVVNHFRDTRIDSIFGWFKSAAGQIDGSSHDLSCGFDPGRDLRGNCDSTTSAEAQEERYSNHRLVWGLLSRVTP